MAIFGYANYSSLSPGAPPHNGTSLDTAMNYLFGITLLAVAITGAFLNVLVFYHKYNNRQNRMKLVPFLFQLLAAVNFFISITTIWPVYCLLQPAQLPLIELQVTIWERATSMTTQGLGGASMNLTCLLCIVRYLKIRDPLQAGNSSRRFIVAACILSLVGYIVCCMVLPGLYLCVGDGEGLFWYSPILATLPIGILKTKYFLLNVPAGIVINEFIALLFSSLTIYRLKSSAGQGFSDEKRQGIKTILLLNVSNIAWLVLTVLYYITDVDGRAVHDYSMTYLQLFLWVMLQPIISIYNPIVICVRSSGIRKLMAPWLRMIRTQTSSVTERDNQPI